MYISKPNESDFCNSLPSNYLPGQLFQASLNKGAPVKPAPSRRAQLLQKGKIRCLNPFLKVFASQFKRTY